MFLTESNHILGKLIHIDPAAITGSKSSCWSNGTFLFTLGPAPYHTCLIAGRLRPVEMTHSLAGQFLISMPTIREGAFHRSVVLMCAHSDDGAMGIVINRPSDHVTFGDLLSKLNVLDDQDMIRVPDHMRQRVVHDGGPVDTTRGFVLHSSDYYIDEATVQIDESVFLTATLEILRAIAEERGPDQALFALGYAGWSAGQLENEIVNNGWLTTDLDPQLIFEKDGDALYEAALGQLGVNPAHLSMDAGRA